MVYPTHAFMSLQMVSHENNVLDTEQVSVFLFGNTLLTIQEGKEGDNWSKIREKLERSESKIRQLGGE